MPYWEREEFKALARQWSAILRDSGGWFHDIEFGDLLESAPGARSVDASGAWFAISEACADIGRRALDERRDLFRGPSDRALWRAVYEHGESIAAAARAAGRSESSARRTVSRIRAELRI